MRHQNIPENIDYHDPAAPWNQQELTEEEYANQILLDHGAYEAAHNLRQGLKSVKNNCPNIWDTYFTDGLRRDALDYFSRIIDALDYLEGASDGYAPPAGIYHFADGANELLAALRKHHEALQQRYNEAVAALNRALEVLAARENNNEKIT